MNELYEKCLKEVVSEALSWNISPRSAIVTAKAHKRYMAMITPPKEHQVTNNELMSEIKKLRKDKS